MLVGTRMSKPVITVHEDTSLEEALDLMQEQNVGRLPVVDAHGRLIGIVSERQLLREHPSEATTLSKWEQKSMMSKISIKKIMTRNVTTITENTTFEEAAKIMAQERISGLPVLDGDKVVGLVTQKDVFKVFMELMGAYEHGLRVTVLVTEKPGELARLTQKIFELGGNIIALGTFLGENTANRKITFKISGIDQTKLIEGITPLVEEIEDIREIPAA